MKGSFLRRFGSFIGLIQCDSKIFAEAFLHNWWYANVFHAIVGAGM